MRSLLVCAVVVSMPALGRAQSPEPREPSAEELAALTKEGHSLSPAQARALLEQLRRDPNDFRSRFRLIAYHGRGGGEAGPHGEPYDSLVLGLIERHPRWRASGEVFLSRGESFEKGVKLWLRLAEANPRDARILGNAGFFLTADVLNLKYRQEGRTLLLEARRLEPRNPRWPGQLGALAQLEIDQIAPAAAVRAQASLALRYLEEADRLTPESERQAGLFRCEPLAQTAYQAGENDKARKYAGALLEAAAGQAESWNYGNAIHHAHTLLGLIALEENKLDDAKRHLLDSARHKGSPQLNSFGPGMELASGLLERGERKTVLEYLDLCSSFWRSSDGRLEKWRTLIRAGGAPDDGWWRRRSRGVR